MWQVLREAKIISATEYLQRNPRSTRYNGLYVYRLINHLSRVQSLVGHFEVMIISFQIPYVLLSLHAISWNDLFEEVLKKYHIDDSLRHDLSPVIQELNCAYALHETCATHISTAFDFISEKAI